MATTTNLITRFLDLYRDQRQAYEEAAGRCHSRCEALMGENAIRCLVTSRCKSENRLREKLEKRGGADGYGSLQEIEADIHDLAGVRIALYFPDDLRLVEDIIRSNFVVSDSPKRFPEPPKAAGKDGTGAPAVVREFSGYKATHFRVSLPHPMVRGAADPEGLLTKRIEIQIASVLMHAWAEVEHDLLYKPQTGDPQEEERELLDMLNGIVLSGEIGLTRLQKAIRARVEGEGALHDRFELRERLFSLRERHHSDMEIGNVDRLFRVLRLSSPAQNFWRELARLVEESIMQDSAKPLAEAVVDRILAEADSEHAHRIRVHLQTRHADASSPSSQQDRFLSLWADFKAALNERAGDGGDELQPVVLMRALNADQGDIARVRGLQEHIAAIRAGETIPERTLDANIGKLVRLIERVED